MSVAKFVIRSAETFLFVEGNTGRAVMARRAPAPRRLRTQARTQASLRDLGGLRAILRGRPRDRSGKAGHAAARDARGGGVRRGHSGDEADEQANRKAASQAADRIRKAARRNPSERLTALLHQITVEALQAAFYSLKQGAAAGLDGARWTDCERGLDGRLADPRLQVRRGTHRAVPVRRVLIPKPDGGQRRLGIAALEDRIVQLALADVVPNRSTKRCF